LQWLSSIFSFDTGNHVTFEKEDGMHNDFFNQLKEEHMEVKHILEQLGKTTTKAAKTRDNLFEKLSQKLLPHMAGEEREFYSVLKEKKEAEEDVFEALEEHHAAKTVFDELRNLPREKDNWGAKLRVFKEMIEHHIKEEEHKIFSDAREAFSHEQIENIFRRYKEMNEKRLYAVGQ
jgi:hemerythrin-like domain-containing protein